MATQSWPGIEETTVALLRFQRWPTFRAFFVWVRKNKTTMGRKWIIIKKNNNS